MKVYLARHGESEGKRLFLGKADPPLSAEGRRQSEVLAERLQQAGIRRIVSSGLARSVQTAEILAARLGTPAEADPRFDEIGYGAWDGLAWDEIERRWPDEVRRKIADWWGVTPAGGEPSADFFARLRLGWNDLLAVDAPTLLVAHVGVNGVLKSWISGEEPLSFHQPCGDFFLLEPK